MSDEEETKLDPIAEELKAKHTEVFSREFEDVGGRMVTVYYRAATAPENDRFTAKAFDDKNPKRQAEGMTELGRACILHPSGADRESLLDRRRGIALAIAGEAIRITAGEGVERGKRL